HPVPAGRGGAVRARARPVAARGSGFYTVLRDFGGALLRGAARAVLARGRPRGDPGHAGRGGVDVLAEVRRAPAPGGGVTAAGPAGASVVAGIGQRTHQGNE